MADPGRSASVRLEDRRLNRRELQREVKARKAALRQRLASQRSQLDPGFREHRQRRQRRRALLVVLLLVLVLLLLRQCDCANPPGPPAAPPTVELPPIEPPAPKVVKPTPKVRKAKRPRRPTIAKIQTKNRPAYAPKPVSPTRWLTAFRLQIAARSPILARCFQGAQRPGALKWTATVDPRRGIVSDHSLEPTLAGAELTQPRRSCLIKALSTPPYRLPKPPGGDAPTRVSIVIEF